jgi:hypothetical protein
MNIKELRTLRGQVLLTVGLFAGSLAIALVIVTNRWWFEKVLLEKPAPATQLSASLKELVNRVNLGKADGVTYGRLLPPEQIALFDAWMQEGKKASKLAPATLVQMDAKLYLQRVEHAVVCGNSAQRQQALQFLVLTRSSEGEQILDRLARWARKRNRSDWYEMIDHARHEWAAQQGVNAKI